MKPLLARTTLAALIGLNLVSCAVHDRATTTITQGTVIRQVTVVDTRTGALQASMAVVIDGGKIARILADAGLQVGGSARAVDGKGKFLVPGYLDMHTHALLQANRSPSPWPTMLAHGITGVREMSGSVELMALSRRLNAERAAGRLDAPEILQVPGDLFVNPMLAPDAAAQLVRDQKAQGASFIKFIVASRPTTLAVLAEARAQGLGVAGHLPLAITATEAATAGWRAIEHFGAGMGVLLDCAADAPAIRAALQRGEGARPPFPPTAITSPMLYRALDAPFYQRILDSQDAAKCDAVAQAFARHQTWQVPTLIRLRSMYFSDDAAYRNDPNLKYVDKTTRALWEQLAQQYAANVPPAAAASFRRYYAAQQHLVGVMKRQGVKMLAGSDLGGIWVIPGVGLHQEFRELAAAGLTPLEVLQSTSLNGAEFLGRLDTMGTVEAGKNADLVLLDANPLLDVANLGKIAAVVLNGKLLTKQDLERQTQAVASANAAQAVGPLSAALGHTH